MQNSTKVSDPMLRFVNSLQVTGDLLVWLTAFRDGLRGLLGDVDRIMVDVNYLCDLDDPEHYNPQKVMTQHVDTGKEEVLAIDAKPFEVQPAERIIQQVRSGGFQLEEYQAPVCYEYYVKDRAYLGTIILWKERGGQGISPTTISLMESLKPFITFLLSDAVARHSFARPVDRAFHIALTRISSELELTDREQEVLSLHLFGYPYQSIAETIHLSIDAVRKYVKSIHRKASVTTYTELFAKYFTPRLFLSDRFSSNEVEV